MKSLSHFLFSVTDPRRKQGRRISLHNFLSMVILGNMSGHSSLQGLSRFFKNNEEYFVSTLGLAHGVPGYTRIRTFLKDIDFQELNKAFSSWAIQFIEPGDWISADEKTLCSTNTDYFESYQNFHSVVSLFCDRLGINVSATTFQSKKESEIKSVIDLIAILKDKGVVITLDALHCQKKPSRLSWSQEMSM